MLDQAVIDEQPIEIIMLEMGKRARQASAAMARISADKRSQALRNMAGNIRRMEAQILSANARDMEVGRRKSLSPSFMDRLELSPERVEAMALGLEAISELPDPVGDVIAEWSRPNGLKISRVRGPIGVIGIIYESRPNVTADAGALALRAGNAAILRGGSESQHSSCVIIEAMQAALQGLGLPVDAIQLVPTTDRAAVGAMLSGLDGQLDIIIPRGGKGLVGRVQDEARIPVIGHLEGICHTYIHKDAILDKAVDIVCNAKMRRPGICGATETVLVDQAVAGQVLPKLAEALAKYDCEIKACEAGCKILSNASPAFEEDWQTEYLAPILSIRIVEDIRQAIMHIGTYGTGHTEAILTEDDATAEIFLRDVDAAIVMHNTSTQFADGGEFGMGAEIGIATGRIHARGPVGAEQLTIFKYVVRGQGQIRP